MTGNLSCPRCNLGLYVGHAAGAVLHGCGSCGGVWVDAATSHRVTQALCSETLQLADSVGQHAASQIDTQSQIACPTCGVALIRHQVQGTAVEVDYCGGGHGTWFDRGELTSVARTLAASRAYGGGGAGGAAVAAGVVGGAAVGAAAVGAAAIAQDPSRVQRAKQYAVDTGDIALDVVDTVDVGDLVDVAEGAAAVAEGSFSILGALFELF